jgi:minor extracellular serine protease Vpr
VKSIVNRTLITLPLLVASSLFAAQSQESATGVAGNPNAHQKFYRPAGITSAVKPLLTAPDVAVVNSASFLPGISPGGLATIFGHNLTDVNGVVVASSNPLPTQFSNVSVIIAGVYAPIYTIAYANGEDQISFQVPYGTPTGLNSVRIQVLDYGNVVADFRTDSYDEDPGIFVWQGNYALALRYPDYSLIGPGNPASRGDILILYTTGLGPLSQNLRDGYAAPSDPLAYTLDPFQVVVAGEQCRLLFSGLAPGFVGLYQINLQLPSDLPAGNLQMQIFSPFANSQIVTLPVR